ncbi:restriction endonuclease subunit S [Novosphingopyxis sp. YJ-S2-01]|uniref:restriction endonuclease subunit S n=1 Tax=Novosphingopyxis sp. YJ-S2-01 TaxID=2794021 RepID=UPI0018DBB207|nr:restriction endonuclease subunit S [Novosphingopyxis sp. YJ-S2-01]MBH9538187.1 restriction endonuclease subunit S [Novosphingopyxis sp. YJ-S2-01]
MEIRRGYKQTEIGVLPADWPVEPLERFLKQRATYGVVKAGKFQSVGIPMLRGGDIAEGRIGSDQPLISVEKSSEYARTVLGENDVVIALVGYPGEAAVVPARLIGANISRAVGLLRTKAELNPNFLVALLNSPSGRAEFLRPSAGSAQIVVNLSALNKMRLPVPSLPEQRAIAVALADVDATISAMIKLLAKKRDLRTATMQRLLTGKERLPGFSKPWQVKKLGDHVSFLKNGTHSRAQLTIEDPIRYLHYGDIHVFPDTHLDLDCNDFPRLPEGEARRLSRLEDGDLVFVDASEDLNGIGKSVEVRGLDEIDLVAGQHTIAVRFDKAVLADGFKAYLQHIPDFTRHLRRLAAGTKVYATNRKHIASAEILLPEPEEQRAIAEVIGDMSIEIATLQRRLSKTTALKQAMMQALLTGRVRLPVETEEDASKELAHA